MFELFRIWLIIVGAALAVGGVALAVFSDIRLAEPLHRTIDAPFWPGTERPDQRTRRFRTFVYGVLGGTMAGWGLMTAILVASHFSSREVWVWWAVALSVGVWFVFDTGRSIWHRVWINVAANTTLLVLVAIPLAGTFAEFH